MIENRAGMASGLAVGEKDFVGIVQAGADVLEHLAIDLVPVGMRWLSLEARQDTAHCIGRRARVAFAVLPPAERNEPVPHLGGRFNIADVVTRTAVAIEAVF